MYRVFGFCHCVLFTVCTFSATASFNGGTDAFTGTDFHVFGVSETMTIPKLKRVLADAHIRPAVNEMELHPHFQQPELFEFICANGIEPVAYSPIGSPARPERDRTSEDTVDIEDPVIVRIAQRWECIRPSSVSNGRSSAGRRRSRSRPIRRTTQQTCAQP